MDNVQSIEFTRPPPIHLDQVYQYLCDRVIHPSSVQYTQGWIRYIYGDVSPDNCLTHYHLQISDLDMSSKRQVYQNIRQYDMCSSTLLCTLTESDDLVGSIYEIISWLERVLNSPEWQPHVRPMEVKEGAPLPAP